MGDSPDAFYVAQETPGTLDPVLQTIPGRPNNLPASHPVNLALGLKSIRDKNGKIARQAARFRIYCYEYHSSLIGGKDRYPTRIWEVTKADYDIEWLVRVANLKSFVGVNHRDAASQRRNEPPEVTLRSTTASDSTTVRAFEVAGRLALGGAVLDGTNGRLLVIGSAGENRPLPGSGAGPDTSGRLDWPEWEDDAADGYVKAFITPRATSPHPDKNQPRRAVDRPAWVVVGIPRYAPDAAHSVSLYDLACDLGMVASNSSKWCNKDYAGPPDFAKDIGPIIKSYSDLRSISEMGRMHYRPDAAVVATPKGSLLHRMRTPRADRYVPEDYFSGSDGTNLPPMDDVRTMPLQPISTTGSDIGLAYPATKYKALSEWEAGKVAGDLSSALNASDPEILDRLHMGSMLGGAFWPGIEVGREAGIYSNWRADFGVGVGHVDIRTHNLVPGQLTADLAVPWQVDYIACASQGIGEWWPASRPIETDPFGGGASRDWLDRPGGGFTDLQSHWQDLGFVRRDPADDKLKEMEWR